VSPVEPAQTASVRPAAVERRLVITADDFGAAPEVNEAVEIAHRRGVLTSTSLMITAPHADDAVARARALPGLRVGLHLNLVEGRPALDPAEIPALVGPDGRFRPYMIATALRIGFDICARAQVEREIRAQFAAFRATGLALDHVDAHRHFHLHPGIAALIVRTGRDFGLTAVRAPVEPAALLGRADGGRTPAPQLVTGPWARLGRAMFRRAGLTVADRVVGLRWSGAMVERRLRGLIEVLPPGLTEVFGHPATRGGFPGAARGYRYADELAALASPAVAEAVRRGGVRLGGYADFRGDADDRR
jgi:hopanoid biosynthesis associated protein HpnK